MKKTPIQFKDINPTYTIYGCCLELDIDLNGEISIFDTSDDEDENGKYFTKRTFNTSLYLNSYQAERFSVILAEMSRKLKIDEENEVKERKATQAKQIKETAKRSKAAKLGKAKSKAKPLKKKTKAKK